MAARSPARKIGYLLERVTETHILALILVILVFLYAREHMLRFAFDSVILFPLLAGLILLLLKLKTKRGRMRKLTNPFHEETESSFILKSLIILFVLAHAWKWIRFTWEWTLLVPVLTLFYVLIHSVMTRRPFFKVLGSIVSFIRAPYAEKEWAADRKIMAVYLIVAANVFIHYYLNGCFFSRELHEIHNLLNHEPLAKRGWNYPVSLITSMFLHHWAHMGGLAAGIGIGLLLKYHDKGFEERHLQIGIDAHEKDLPLVDGKRSLRLHLEQRPDNPQAWLALARLSSRILPTQSGLEAYRKAVGFFIQAAPARALRVYEEFSGRYRHGLDPETLFLLGSISQRRGNLKQAMLLFKKLHLSDTDPRALREKALFNLAQVQVERGELAGAWKRFSQFLELYPGSDFRPYVLNKLELIASAQVNPEKCSPKQGV